MFCWNKRKKDESPAKYKIIDRAIIDSEAIETLIKKENIETRAIISNYSFEILNTVKKNEKLNEKTNNYNKSLPAEINNFPFLKSPCRCRCEADSKKRPNLNNFNDPKPFGKSKMTINRNMPSESCQVLGK